MHKRIGMLALLAVLLVACRSKAEPSTPLPPTQVAVQANTPVPPGTATLTALSPSATLPVSLSSCPPPLGWSPVMIQAGDTLEGLAKVYNATVEALIQANCLVTEELTPGTLLYLPGVPPTESPIQCGPPPGWIFYTVQPGDTLFSIGEAFGVPVTEIKLANCLDSSTLLRAGSRIFVPNVHTRTPTTEPTQPVPATPTPVPPTNSPTPRPTSTSTPTSIPTMAPVAAKTRVRPSDGMVMVYVPAGEFLMGSAGRENPNEKPQHTVFLDAFWIDRTEATVSQFRLFVQASGYITRAEEKGRAFAWVESAKEWQEVDGADWLHPFGPESAAEDNHPVVQVSWFDAEAYCTWAGGSLPSEAQWEKAARGTDGRIYPWGNVFDGTRMNYCDASCEGGDTAFNDGYRFTAPIGSYPAGASPYGALDMSGNVWEWTADYYDDGYYAVSPAQNPTGPETGQYRLLRGGSWNHDRSGMRTAIRLDSPSGFSVDNFGFRCAWQEVH